MDGTDIANPLYDKEFKGIFSFIKNLSTGLKQEFYVFFTGVMSFFSIRD
jgi:hypothetical protein